MSDSGKKYSFESEWYGTKSKRGQNWKPQKLFVFCQRVTFKILTKSATNLGHFALKVVNEMKQRSI